ncbi:MAG: TonB-dependent outer rane receptor FecA5 [Sphingomonas bacterium]|uniref:TonB-dependent receptor n=1 Tax=Sphingomonas bacterium TaxID=1895847 RepID=UPI00262E1C98|nr:TonB-dependent receptor [Sphingomonas bacterium]MDB5709560.1 TonB-dependent outer rane receptor FecA5 [Sphingomonas bacterium]
MSNATTTRRLLSGASALILATLSSAVQAETKAATPAVDTAPAAPAADDPQKIAEGSDIVVTATRANEIAPVTASLQTTQPQSIISRSFIEDSLPATSDFNQIAMISPSVSGYGNANGPGLSESKAQIRGFQDGEYNITYDGVPFGDTNDPTHHSNTFFPSNTIETLIVDRGPGNASQLGQATFGGNINLFSRATRDDMGVELKASYGSYNTYLLRGVFQSGAIDKLGGTEIVLSGQHIKSDGARTFSPFSSNNIFGKIMIPIGPNAKLTLLGTYNENSFNQPDKDGTTLSQAALYGKYFSLNNDPNTQNYFGYNHTHKTTDFEIVKFEATLAPGATFENRAYTYSYDNETLSGNDVTIFGTTTPTATTAAQVAAAVTAANVVKLTLGSPATSFGVPGYTKTNKYRMFGDIAKTRIDFGFGAITAGAWLEWSNTYRQQRDVNLVTMAANYAEKAATDPVTGIATPANVKFDQNSHTEHTEEFVELELRPLPGLKITPGFKHVDFNRRIMATYNQTTRYPQSLSDTYTANLPFATINYAVNDKLAVYAQYARGFLAPSLSVLYVANPGLSTVEPERSTNYQAGAVYHGGSLSVDVDIYKIDFTNKFASFTSPVPGEGTVFINQGAVQYKGIEGQITYALPRGFALFANGSRNYAKTDNAGSPHQQVANAPEFTAAGGLLYKHGPIRFSLIDKYTGPQWFVTGDDNYRSSGYNTAILSARYDIGPVRIGVEVNNLFNSRRVTNISQNSAVTVAGVKYYPYDQYVFQTGRSFTGDVTLTF